MYTSFFGLTENPFHLTPDPRYLFFSPYHKEALDHLLYGITEKKGFIVITGGIGTGKTTLCRVLLEHLETDTKSALIFHSFISDMELLESIIQEFGIRMESPAKTKKDYIDALNRFLLDTFAHGGNAVLLIDEAQNLSHAVLEQIRMLSNLETEREKLIQIVLVGQPELNELLSAPSIRQLNDRITVRYDLKPLAFKDIRGYIDHRLIVAGGRGNLKFARKAFREIYAYSKGTPRRINTLCDRALLVAYAKEKTLISKGVVKRALKELHGDTYSAQFRPRRSWIRLAIPVLLILCLFFLAGLGGWRFKENIMNVLVNQDKVAVQEAPPSEASPSEAPPSEEPRKEDQAPVSVFLDDQTSLAGLFTLINSQSKKRGRDLTEVSLNLVQFTIAPEYFVLLKKPFRVRVSKPGENDLSADRYLLILEITADGAIARDEEGRDETISREFILSHWGENVSWVYPSDHQQIPLTKGMTGPGVSALQKVLDKIGYLVTLNGQYDDETFQQTMKFQEDFGLTADGIAGPRTRALLYQMSG